MIRRENYPEIEIIFCEKIRRSINCFNGILGHVLRRALFFQTLFWQLAGCIALGYICGLCNWRQRSRRSVRRPSSTYAGSQSSCDKYVQTPIWWRGAKISMHAVVFYAINFHIDACFDNCFCQSWGAVGPRIIRSFRQIQHLVLISCYVEYKWNHIMRTCCSSLPVKTLKRISFAWNRWWWR